MVDRVGVVEIDGSWWMSEILCVVSLRKDGLSRIKKCLEHWDRRTMEFVRYSKVPFLC